MIKSLFDATHYFILEETEDGKTRFIHGENFRGILAGPLMIMLEKSTLGGFERMNNALMKLAENRGSAIRNNASG